MTDIEDIWKPDQNDCCNSGCNPCILDVYEEQLKRKHPSNNKQNCLFPTIYSIFKLIKVERVSETSFIYTFQFLKYQREINCSDEVEVKFEPGQHMLLKAKMNGEEFTRAYTPLPDKVEKGFKVLIKLYENGLMSKYLKKLKIGQKTLWRGPYGDFALKYNYKYVLTIAQGTGIAPIYNVIVKLLNQPDCYSFIKLFFCCSSIDGIFLRNELYSLLSFWNFKYEVFLSNDNGLERKYNEVVFSNKLGLEHVKNYLDGKEGDSLQVLICGSDQFSQSIKTLIIKCGVLSDNIYIF